MTFVLLFVSILGRLVFFGRLVLPSLLDLQVSRNGSITEGNTFPGKENWEGMAARAQRAT